jgi:hypothetical protein
VQASVARVTNGTFTGNDVGMMAGLCELRTSTVTGNLSRGVDCKKVRLVDSIAVGNPDGAGIDIESDRPPALLGASVCGRSLNPATGGSWSVCTND